MTIRLVTTTVLLALLMAMVCNVVYSDTYYDGSPRVSETALWEDGSFQVGMLTGCLPGALCD